MIDNPSCNSQIGFIHFPVNQKLPQLIVTNAHNNKRCLRNVEISALKNILVRHTYVPELGYRTPYVASLLTHKNEEVLNSLQSRCRHF